ncbi:MULTISPECIES: hypothetical protein [Aurantimonas]|uniref:hypothetical protein n=1 Tax=Aurantimonas TaxID=182269 RepID=UPI0035148016
MPIEAPAHIHVSEHAILRYWQCVLKKTDRPHGDEFHEIEAEIFCLLHRCHLPQFPRYVAIVGDARFVIVHSTVVTTLCRNGRGAWTGPNRPGFQSEVEINAE